MLGHSGLNKCAPSFPFWLVNIDLQHTAAAWSRACYSKTVRHSGLSLLVMSHRTKNVVLVVLTISVPIRLHEEPEVFRGHQGYAEALSLFNYPDSTLNDSSIAVKMSMGNSQLVQWNFHSTFRSGRAVQREENSSMLERIQWKHQGHHDLQTTTNLLNFILQKPFPRYWAKQCCLYECEPTTAAN